MALLTLDAARTAAGAVSAETAQKSLRASAAAADPSRRFDVFLSHSIADARAISGVKSILERAGLSVYVDWIDDPLLDRERVSYRSAEVLRGRMQQSSSLIFATSEASVGSKWMPWELGYFDG